MSNMRDAELLKNPQQKEILSGTKLKYIMPVLRCYGSLRDLTQSGGTRNTEGASGKGHSA